MHGPTSDNMGSLPWVLSIPAYLLGILVEKYKYLPLNIEIVIPGSPPCVSGDYQTGGVGWSRMETSTWI